MKLLLTSLALASTLALTNAEDIRLNTTYSGNLSNARTVRTTLGVAPNGTWDLGPIPSVGQVNETFRAYDVWEPTAHYTAFGLKTPELKLGETTHKAIAYGATDDRAGLGLETQHAFSKLALTLNAEHLFQQPTTRLGTGLDYQLTEKLSLGGGYDIAGATKQWLGHAHYDLSPRTTLGAVGGISETAGNRESFLGGLLIIGGKKGEVGLFAHGDYTWSNAGKTFGGQLFIAEHPTKANKYGGLWTIGRSPGNDDRFNPGALPLSVSRYEPLTLFDYSLGGWSLSLEGTKRMPGTDELKYGAGYFVKPKVFGNGRPGISCEVRHQFTPTTTSTFIEPSFVWRQKLGPAKYLAPFLGASIPVGNNTQPLILKGGVGYTW